MSSTNDSGQLGLAVLGIGTQYPPYELKSDAIDTLVRRYHNADSPAMKKVMSINRYTGIEVTGPSLTPRHEVWLTPNPRVVRQLATLITPLSTNQNPLRLRSFTRSSCVTACPWP